MSVRLGRALALGPVSLDSYVATDHGFLEARAEGAIQDTLTFLHFDRPGVLLGYHQSAAEELRLERVSALGVPVQRRVTGGGALYVDDGVFGWELFLGREALAGRDLAGYASRLCEMAARGLSRLGIDARYRPRNDIEVDGRKICGTGGLVEGEALLYHGSVLLDFDVAKMLDLLRIPVEKWRDKAIASARERVTSIRDLIGRRPADDEVAGVLREAFSEGLGIDFQESALTAQDHARVQAARAIITDPEWLAMVDRSGSDTRIRQALWRGVGGTLRAGVLVDERLSRLKQVWITGDFFVQPRRVIADLEAALRELPAERLRDTVEEFFARQPADLMGLVAGDFIAVIECALSTEEAFA